MRRNKPEYSPVLLNGEPVEIVTTFRYLGIVLSNDMTWTEHVLHVTKKAHNRLFFLRNLKQAGVDSSILVLFYKSVVLSVMVYNISVFFNASQVLNQNRLKKVCWIAIKIINPKSPLDSLDLLYINRLVQKDKSICEDISHPLNHKFNLLPSGRRLRSASTRSTRYNKTFVPSAISAMNLSK